MSNNQPPLWLYLHFPQLQLDSLHASAASAQEVATIIIDPDSHVVCQLNAAARNQGVKQNMGLATASVLCQPLNILSLKPAFEQQRLQELAHIFYQTSADIALFEPQGMVFEVSSMLALHGSLNDYLSLIQQHLSEQQAVAHQALASSPLAAKVLAQSSNKAIFQNADTLLGQLDISHLDLPAQQLSQLRRIGMQTLEDIEGLSRRELGLRFGAALPRYIDQLRNRQATPLSYFKTQACFSRSLMLEHEMKQSSALLFPAKSLLNSLQVFLQSRAALSQKIKLVLTNRGGEELVIELASAEAERNQQVWLNLLKLKLESYRLKAPILGVRLECHDFQEPSQASTDLFSARQALSPKQLVSRLQAKIGGDHIQAIRLKQDYRPEHSFHYHPVDETLGSTKRHEETAPCMLRPTLLLDPPRELHETLQIIHGPERIQSAWWSSDPICRDYFVARNTRQQTLWVFRDQQQQWFVHGLFA